MLNICRLITSFPVRQQVSIDGPAAPGPYDLSRAQAQRGANVHVVCLGYPKLPKYEFVDGIHVHRVLGIGRPLLQIVTYGISLLPEVSRLNSIHHFDVIHGHNYDSFAFALAKDFFHNIRFAISVHSTTEGEQRRTVIDSRLWQLIKEKCDTSMNTLNGLIVSSASKYMEKSTYQRADVLLAVSESIKGELVKFYGVTSDKVVNVLNGVNADHFSPKQLGTARVRFGIRDKEAIVLCVANFGVGKGTYYLIQAIPKILSEIRDIKFLFVGARGWAKPALKQLIIDLSLQDSIVLVETVPHAEMPGIYSDADVVVLPTQSEGLSKVLLEAMASERPIVATRVGGNPEAVINGETGILVEPRNPRQLAEGILEVLSDRSIAREMGKKGRQRVLKYFTWDKVAKRVEHAYSKAKQRR